MWCFFKDVIFLFLPYLVFSLFMFLGTLNMLTDRAGCYNVHEKNLFYLYDLAFTVFSHFEHAYG